MGADAIVIRHSSSGSPLQLTRWVDGRVLNAGDGTHEHPTQALLDLYTMRERLGRLEGLRVAIVGDVLHSRVARSLSFGLVKMGAEVTLVGPPTLIPPEAPAWGVQVSYDLDGRAAEAGRLLHAARADASVSGCEYFPSVREYARLFGLTTERAAMLPERALIMHPGPMNRGVEIDSDVADLPRAVIEEQVTNGIAVRMSLLYLLLGGDRREGGGDERARSSSAASAWSIPRPASTRCATSLVDDGDREVGRPTRRGRRADRRRRPRAGTRAWSTCTRTCASPGFEHKETIETGTRAAAAGGYTAVCAMANTDPVGRQRGDRRRRSATSRRRPGSCDVFPVGAITQGPARASRSPRWARWSRPASGCSPTTGTACRRPRLLRNALDLREGVPGGRRDRRARGGRFARSRAGRCTRASTPRRSASPGRPGRGRGGHRRARPRGRAGCGGRLHLCHLSSRAGRWSWCGARRPRASASPRR